MGGTTAQSPVSKGPLPGQPHPHPARLAPPAHPTPKRLKKDYYLYIVLHCASTPSLNVFQDPAILDWQPIVKVEHYRLRQDSIKHPVELKEEPTTYHTGGGT